MIKATIAIMLPAILKELPIVALISSINCIVLNTPGVLAHSPIHSKVNIVCKLKRK